EPELGGFQARGELALIAGEPFGVGEEADEAERHERLAGRLRLPLAERRDHAVELELREGVERGFEQHAIHPFARHEPRRCDPRADAARISGSTWGRGHWRGAGAAAARPRSGAARRRDGGGGSRARSCRSRGGTGASGRTRARAARAATAWRAA